MNRSNHLIWLTIIVMAGCIDPVVPISYEDPSSLGVETTQSGITLELISPESASISASPGVMLVFSVFTEDNSPITLQVGRAGTILDDTDIEGAPGPDQRFKTNVLLLPGTNKFRLRAVREDGRQRTLDFSLFYNGAAPGMSVSGLFAPTEAGCDPFGEEIHSPTHFQHICLAGNVLVGNSEDMDQNGIAGIEFSVQGVSVGEAQLENESFVAEISLEENTQNQIGISVRDERGNIGSGIYSVTHDGLAPALTITNPTTLDTSTTASSIQIAGTTSDDTEVSSIRIETNGLGTTYLPVASTFDYEINLQNGENQIDIVVQDSAGNETREQCNILRDRIIRLSPPSDETGAAVVSLDQFGLETFLSEEDQRDLLLLEIPLRDFMNSSLTAIKDPESSGVDTNLWGAAEWNMWQLLNMTPDTADLTGTSIEELIAISGAIGLPAPRLLAELHQIEVTDTFLSQETIVDVMLNDVIGSHPNALRNDDGEIVMAISLYDGLNALAPLAEHFGPVGNHPGFLVGETHSEVMEPGFSLSVQANSNLNQFQGINAGTGSKDYIFILEGDQVLSFDFLDDETFNVVGLVDEPTVDLQFRMPENDLAFAAGTERFVGPDPEEDGFYFGNSGAWAAEPWEIEHVIIQAGYNNFHALWHETEYRHEFHYQAGSIEDAAVINWDHGWLDIHTSGGIGNPPAPSYIWDVLTEIAQLRLHDDGINEGEGEAVFSLTNIPVGLHADELIDALRPSMQEQQETLSETLFGSEGGLATSGCDFYFVLGSNEEPLLFFRDQEDTQEAYINVVPGFFSDPALTTIVSSLSVLAGTTDLIHHKVIAQSGAVFYFQNLEERRFRIEIVDFTNHTLGILLSELEEE